MSSNSVGVSTKLSQVVAARESESALWNAVAAYLKLWASRLMKRESRLQRHLEDNDLAHDAFVELKVRGLDVRTSFACKARIRSVLQWRLLDEARRSIRRSKRQVDDAEGCIANVSVTDPELQLEVGLIARCLDYLSDEDRHLLHRRIVDDAPIKELLVEFQCSRAEYYKRYVRALNRLSVVAKRLKQEEQQ